MKIEIDAQRRASAAVDKGFGPAFNRAIESLDKEILMKLKTILFSAVLAATAGLGMGMSTAIDAQEFPTCNDCFGIRYECFAQCPAQGGSLCRELCQLEYQECQANCQPL